jgi:protein SCO1/2
MLCALRRLPLSARAQSRHFSVQQPSAVVQRGSPIGWVSLFLTIGVGAGAVGYYLNEKEKSRARMLSSQTKSIGKPLLGGPFTLVDGNGKVVSTQEVLKGRFGLLYFGFCACPDICPS